jgi:hypothetical protein
MSLDNYITTTHAFLEDVGTWFPNHAPILEYKRVFDQDPRAAAIEFAASFDGGASETSNSVAHGHPNVYERTQMPIGSGLDVHDLYIMASNDQQRESIRAYTRALLIMASTIAALTADALRTIDSWAAAFMSGNASLESLMQMDTKAFDEETMSDLCRLMLPGMEMDAFAVGTCGQETEEKNVLPYEE